MARFGVVAELLRRNEAAQDEAGGAHPGPDRMLPAVHADQRDGTDDTDGLHRSAPDRRWLSDAYRDDPDDIFGDDNQGDSGGVDDSNEPARSSDGSADDARPESRVDHPDLPGGAPVHYGVDHTRRGGRLVRPELFDGEPTREQAVQGGLGDCGVIAALGAVAGHRPEAVRDLVGQREDGSYLVRLHDVRRTGPGSWEPTGRRVDLAVSPDLPVLDAAPHRAAFANTHDTGVGWAAILEKALAGVDATWTPERSQAAGHRGYDRLDRGTYPTDQAELLAQLTGRPAAAHPVDASPGNEPAVERWLRDRLDAGSPVLVGTSAGDRYGRLPNELAPGHAYEVVGAEDGRILLRNPWGRDHPEPLDTRGFLDSIVPFVSTLQDEEEHP